MNLRGVLAVLGGVVLACSGLAGCGAVERALDEDPFTLPVGPTQWDADAPAWYHDGTLHVGERSVRLGKDVDEFVVGATGAYWMRHHTLMFTSAEGKTHKVAEVGSSNMAISADGSVLATVDQSRGPTDKYGTHVMQVAAFDTRTGEQLYRTPDEEPDSGDDLADLYEEIAPLLVGVSNERLFFDGATIDLTDPSSKPVRPRDGGLYEGWSETLFPDGYDVGLKGEGARRVVDDAGWGVGLLSPDRSTLFDVSEWPTAPVLYDARTGQRRTIDERWQHFTIKGWSDADTFFGIADFPGGPRVAPDLRGRSQVVSCDLPALECTPVSPAIMPSDDPEDPGLLMEGAPW